MANKILFYSAVADTPLQSCLLPLQHPTYIMRPEDVSTIFWAYLLLGDGEMYLFKIEGEEANLKRMRRWIIKDKPFYSADNIPQWAKDKLVEHWSGSYHDRMKNLVISMRMFYSVKEPFAVLDDVVYFNDSGREKLIDYIFRRGLMSPLDVYRLKNDLKASTDMTESLIDKLLYQ